MPSLQASAVKELAASVQGAIVLPESADYDEVRSIWNAMIDRRPAIFVRCANTADVVTALAFGRKQGLAVAVRGAGHNIAGNAVCDDGLVIDLSLMKTVTVDTATRRVHVGPGATLGDLDAATQEHGLVVPTGINSTTGVSGLTLGGGFGWLTRKFGMTIDNLVSAEVVTADGRTLRASEKENADLFWALRGGGGNFGIVTDFEFQAHAFGPDVFAGLIVFPLAEAKTVLSRNRDYLSRATEDLNIWVVLRQAPPLPFLPPEVHGKEVVVLAVFYAGDAEGGEKLIAPVRKFGTPVGEHVGTQPFAAWQQAFDPLLTPGARNYWKSHNFSELTEGLFDVAIDYTRRLPSPECEIFIGALGGAAGKVAPDAMAYGNRDANFVMNVHGRWREPEQDAAGIKWARDFFQATKPFATGGVYVNFMTDDEKDRISAAYGPNHARLAKIKAVYDPENVFHMNQNIKPANGG